MISKRQRRLEAHKQMSKPEAAFYQIELDEYHSQGQYLWMTRAFRNNKYTVMINGTAATTHGPAIRAMVQKHDDTPFINHWSEMQRIKNEIFGRETMAIEYYPAESELVNDHNIYWMWIFPDAVIPRPL